MMETLKAGLREALAGAAIIGAAVMTLDFILNGGRWEIWKRRKK